MTAPKSYRKMNTQRGFTLVELLLVMSILAVLATLSLAVVSDAQFNARKSATQTRISLLERLLAERMENYSVQTSPVDNLLNYVDNSTDADIAIAREVGRRILLEVLNSEMPRSFGDVALNNLGANSFPSTRFTEWVNDNTNLFAAGSPDGATRLINDLRLPGSVTFNARLFQQRSTVEPSNYPDDSSEYLFLILSATEIDGQLRR